MVEIVNILGFFCAGKVYVFICYDIFEFQHTTTAATFDFVRNEVVLQCVDDYNFNLVDSRCFPVGYFLFCKSAKQKKQNFERLPCDCCTRRC